MTRREAFIQSSRRSPLFTRVCRYGGDEPYIRSKLDILFEQQAALYNAGARNFLFIDVPPIHMCPGAPSKGYPHRVDHDKEC